MLGNHLLQPLAPLLPLKAPSSTTVNHREQPVGEAINDVLGRKRQRGHFLGDWVMVDEVLYGLVETPILIEELLLCGDDLLRESVPCFLGGGDFLRHVGKR